MGYVSEIVWLLNFFSQKGKKVLVSVLVLNYSSALLGTVLSVSTDKELALAHILQRLRTGLVRPKQELTTFFLPAL